MWNTLWPSVTRMSERLEELGVDEGMEADDD
jgi:hypothetical protein